MFARIEGDKVMEVLDVPDITGMFHKSLDWRPCPPNCQQGWVVLDGQIINPGHYMARRTRRMPPENVQLHALWEIVGALVAVNSAAQLSDDAQAVLTRVQNVCNQFPKP